MEHFNSRLTLAVSHGNYMAMLIRPNRNTTKKPPKIVVRVCYFQLCYQLKIFTPDSHSDKKFVC